MKRLYSIVISFLAFLCAGSFITFIIVFLNTRANVDISALLRFPASRTTVRGESGGAAAVLIPDRFKTIAETSVIDPAAKGFIDSSTDRAPAPKFTRKHACLAKLDSDDMLLLIMENNFFCRKSQWSQHWNNPRGKGIRRATEGLRFTDSTVADSFTSITWQRYSKFPSIAYAQIEDTLQHLNSGRWGGFDDWRAPTIEEIMALLVPKRNRYGLYLPGGWNCNVKDIWSCNPACDSLSTQWIWVARLGKGRCNYGHPEIGRALLAVRDMAGRKQ